MRVSIVTRYLREEVTYAAIRLAELLQSAGAAVKIGCPENGHAPKVHPQWDRRVDIVPDYEFHTWAERETTIIWTHIPHHVPLNWANHRGIRTVWVPSWDEIDAEDVELGRCFDKVMTPSAAARELFVAQGMPHAECVRWDTGMPYFRKPELPHAGPFRLLLPLDYARPARVDGLVLSGLEHLLQNTDAYVTVVHLPRHWLPAQRRRLAQLARMYPQLTIASRCTPDQMSVLFALHDLTVLPTQTATFCWAALLSLAMGTPIFSVKVDPLPEIVRPEAGILLPSPVRLTAAGAQIALPKYLTFFHRLVELVQNPESIPQLAPETKIAHERRAEFFRRKWLSVIR